MVIKQINNTISIFKIVIDSNLKRLKEIKYNLSNGKMNLIDKRDKYYNLDNNQNNINNKMKKTKTKNNIKIKKEEEEDDKKLNFAIKGNYEQIYKYELDKMNELIDDNNKIYNNIFIELDAINSNSIITIKEKFIEFANIIKNVGQTLDLLSLEIISKLESSEELNKEKILSKLNDKKQIKKERFKKEMIENNDLSIKKAKSEINNKEKYYNP